MNYVLHTSTNVPSCFYSSSVFRPQSLPCPSRRSWQVMRTGFMDSTGNLRLTKVLVHFLDWSSNCFCIFSKRYQKLLLFEVCHSSVSPCRRRAATTSQFAFSLHGQNHDHLGSRGGLWGLGGAGQCRRVYTRSSGPNNNNHKQQSISHFLLLPSFSVSVDSSGSPLVFSLPPSTSVSSLPNTAASGIAVRDGEDAQSVTQHCVETRRTCPPPPITHAKTPL